jgi:hypothetical protein
LDNRDLRNRLGLNLPAKLEGICQERKALFFRRHGEPYCAEVKKSPDNRDPARPKTLRMRGFINRSAGTQSVLWHARVWLIRILCNPAKDLGAGMLQASGSLQMTLATSVS